MSGYATEFNYKKNHHVESSAVNKSPVGSSATNVDRSARRSYFVESSAIQTNHPVERSARRSHLVES